MDNGTPILRACDAALSLHTENSRNLNRTKPNQFARSRPLIHGESVRIFVGKHSQSSGAWQEDTRPPASGKNPYTAGPVSSPSPGHFVPRGHSPAGPGDCQSPPASRTVQPNHPHSSLLRFSSLGLPVTLPESRSTDPPNPSHGTRRKRITVPSDHPSRVSPHGHSDDLRFELEPPCILSMAAADSDAGGAQAAAAA